MSETTRFDPEPDDITHIHHYTGAVTLPNSTALSPLLSLRARGLLLHLMALRTSEDAPLRTGEVYRSVPEGRDAVATAVAELRCARYLTQRKERVVTNTGAAYFITVTHVYPTPQAASEKSAPAPEENRMSASPHRQQGQKSAVAPRTGSQGVGKALEIGSPGSNSVGTSSRTQTPTESSSAPGRRAATSRRAIAEAQAAAEEAIDPVRALEATWAAEQAPARAPAPARTRSVSAGEKLARYFDSVAHLHTDAPEPTNVAALGGTFNRWRRDGLETATIRAMIGAYFEPGFARKDARAPWKDFIAARCALAARVGPGGAAPTGEDHRHDAAYWAPAVA